MVMRAEEVAQMQLLAYDDSCEEEVGLDGQGTSAGLSRCCRRVSSKINGLMAWSKGSGARVPKFLRRQAENGQDREEEEQALRPCVIDLEAMYDFQPVSERSPSVRAGAR